MPLGGVTFVLALMMVFSQITMLYRFGIYLIINLFFSFMNLFVVFTAGILICGPVNNKIMVKNNGRNCHSYLTPSKVTLNKILTDNPISMTPFPIFQTIPYNFVIILRCNRRYIASLGMHDRLSQGSWEAFMSSLVRLISSPSLSSISLPSPCPSLL